MIEWGDEGHSLRPGPQEEAVGSMDAVGGGLVSWGCCDNSPQTRWLQRQRVTASQFWRLDVQDGITGRLGPFRGL